MTFISLAKKIEKLVVDNSPAILTTIGVTGSLTMAYFAGTASYKAAEILLAEQRTLNNKAQAGEPEHILEPKEKFLLVWKLYIPAAGTGILTITSIVGANRIGARRAAAMAAAFSLSEKAIAEYKDKVVEKIGDVKEKKIRDEIAQDRVDKHPVSSRGVILTGNGEVLCYEAYTDRYFKSSMEALKSAQNELNFEILNNHYASLTDFYRLVGLPPTSCSSDFGWNHDKIMDLVITTCMSDDDQPCISIDYDIVPIREYEHFT